MNRYGKKLDKKHFIPNDIGEDDQKAMEIAEEIGGLNSEKLEKLSRAINLLAKRAA